MTILLGGVCKGQDLLETAISVNLGSAGPVSFIKEGIWTKRPAHEEER